MKKILFGLILISLTCILSASQLADPVIIHGTVFLENGPAMAGYNLHNNIAVQADGSFTIQEGINNITLGDTLFLNAAPEGYEFYPKKIIVDQPKNVNIVCYKGIVIDRPYTAGSSIHWDSDSVNVFTDIILDSSTLAVRSNTKIKFHGHYGIRLSGKSSIKAMGTSDKPIIFTCSDTTGFRPFKPAGFETGKGGWNSIVFRNMSETADSSIFHFCTFEFNKGMSSCGTESSAITVLNSVKVSISYCTFYKNYAGFDLCYAPGSGGGAIRAENARLTIDNCLFNENYCSSQINYSGGGAICAYGSRLKIINCSFFNNFTKNSTGGAIFSSDSFVDIYNSILYGNIDNAGNNSLYYDPFSSYGASFNVYNCDIEGGNTFEANVYQNSFSAEPLFKNAHTGDFSLLLNSPCINAGNLSYILPGDSVDINGNNRVHQGLIDLGPCEYQNDISLMISGNLQKENGDIMAGYELLPGITTDVNGEFQIDIDNSGFVFGDTLEFINPVGYEIYPSRVFIKWDNARSLNLVAYKGIVIDEADSFKDDVTWNTDTVNVFRNIEITSTKLTVAKGTVVRFHDYYGINISGNGIISAEGTATDTIIFTTAYPQLADPNSSYVSNCWKGINFNNSTSQTEKSLLAYCKIEYGKRNSYNEAGGIQVNHNDNVIIRNCEISNNRGMGAIGVMDSDIEISNSDISHNHVPNIAMWMYACGGAGLHIIDSNPHIIGCIISYNYTPAVGGGILLDNSSPTIINCSVINNDADYQCIGQSIFLLRNSFPVIFNSILTGDGSIQINDYEQNSNAVKIYNSVIKGGNSISAGVYKNSYSLDSQLSDIMNTDFSLTDGSPCINQGTDSLLASISGRDIHNNLRKMGKAVDIGACEFKETTVYITAPDEARLDSTILLKGNVFMGTVSAWSWDFNGDDIEDSNGQEPEYSYSQTGDYIVRLIATVVESGKNDTVSCNIHIVAAPEANFSVDTTNGTAPLLIHFTDQSLNAPTSWSWDFGDGSVSSVQNPSHNYTAFGTYTVKLVARNITGQDSVIYENFITVTVPAISEGFGTNNIFVSPNPAHSYLNISADKNYDIRLLDITGRLLKQTTMINNTSTIDISSYQGGILILQLMKDGEIIVRKIMKE